MLIEKTPEESFKGLSLLATQTTVCLGTLWYHIPTYQVFGIITGGEETQGKDFSRREQHVAVFEGLVCGYCG